jgi:hypothetical protein
LAKETLETYANMTATKKKLTQFDNEQHLRVAVCEALGWKFKLLDDEPVEQWHDERGRPTLGSRMPKYSSSLDPWRELFASAGFPRAVFLEELENLGVDNRNQLLRAHPIVLCQAYLRARGLPYE